MHQFSYMEVKTGVLKNQLSRYLRHVREKGESAIVLDRDRPIAEIRPYRELEAPTRPSVWEIRKEDEEQHGKWSEDFELPTRMIFNRKRWDPLG